MSEEKVYTIDEVLIQQVKLLSDEQKKEETTTKEKIEISLVIVKIHEALTQF